MLDSSHHKLANPHTHTHRYFKLFSFDATPSNHWVRITNYVGHYTNQVSPNGLFTAFMIIILRNILLMQNNRFCLCFPKDSFFKHCTCLLKPWIHLIPLKLFLIRVRFEVSERNRKLGVGREDTRNL